jgi:glycosyltransferase involved in cell wall biosynthesis
VNDRVLISVVIPWQEGRTRVDVALRSVLDDPDLSEFEVIVVKSGSADRRAACCPDIQEPRVVTMQLRPGQSASRLWNVGLARAAGSFVAFLEPDDVLSRRMLSSAVDELDRHPEAGFAFSDAEYIDASGRATRWPTVSSFPSLHTLASTPFENRWQLIRRERLARRLLEMNLTSVSGLVLRRQLLTVIGPFDERLADWSELDLWFRLGHCCDALYLSEVALSRRPTCIRMPRSDLHGCLIALQRERDRWIDRTARHQLNRRMAQCIATVASEERERQHHLRSTTMFLCACAVSREIRWLKEILRSILWTLRAAGRSIRLQSRWSTR